ncbi:hypothetical protein FK178_06720 [Antarcticibacterium arcticum]|uniref:Uncharacterized protein n=1 Tax=Antarcticibacterium arcticum TaxID=2585771 RepID=A0A5B8YHG1_9FLAO|nr:hypothetical protein [Antarcticibacterium arcticum]QED37432.1 hypothetical protein FK178_06720 [Antarcticibacterium arcticum]
MAIILVLTFFSLGSYGQRERPDLSKEDYLQKSKNQRTAGWVLLGAGAATATVGLRIASQEEWFWDDSGKFEQGMSIFLVGATSSLLSIPFFISSGSNARKAARLSFDGQRYIVPGQELSKIQPSLSLTLEF